MSIQDLITEGRKRKIAKNLEEYEASLRREEKEQDEHAKSWQPILQRVAQCLPSELAHALITPEHKAQTGDIENRRNAEFVIRIPETGICINCNPEIQWQREPTFQAMLPVVAWDEFGDIGYYIRHEKHGNVTADFLIALAEAAEFAELLPALQAKADAKNAEWLAKEDEPKPEPAPESIDWLAEAKNDYRQSLDSAASAALIAIAQELRIINERKGSIK